MGRKPTSCPPKLQAAIDLANLVPDDYSKADLVAVLNSIRSEADPDGWLDRNKKSSWKALLSFCPLPRLSDGRADPNYKKVVERGFLPEVHRWYEIKIALRALIDVIAALGEEKGVHTVSPRAENVVDWSDIMAAIGGQGDTRPIDTKQSSSRVLHMTGNKEIEISGRIFSVVIPFLSEWEIRSDWTIAKAGEIVPGVLDWIAAERIKVERLAICPSCNKIFWRKQMSRLRQSETCGVRSCANKLDKSKRKGGKSCERIQTMEG